MSTDLLKSLPFTRRYSISKREREAGGYVPTPKVHPHAFASESAFIRMLILERKRSDRSRRPFLLMLLCCKELLHASPDTEVLPQLAFAISMGTRETDFVGWYKQDSVIGVLFTEFGSAADLRTVQEFILTKVDADLRRYFDEEQVDRIQVSLHSYPEQWDANKSEPAADPMLYPEIPRESKKLADHAKRTLDVLGSVFAILLLSPLFAVIAILIKLASKGPILFKQIRVGRYGKKFTFLKFRSMIPANDPEVHRNFVRQYISGEVDKTEAKADNAPVYKIKRDPRVTPIGRILRKTSLDELPQFINVLCGDMSLVGPRPPLPYEVDTYAAWHRRRVLEAKPGITGLWQISGRSRIRFDDMVRLDLRYVKSWSIWLDLRILLQTPRAVLSGDGAY